MFRAFLAGRKVLPQNFTRFFPSEISNFGLGKRGLFRKVHFLEILENLETLEILENLQIVEKKGESDHVLENFENLEILEIPPAKRPFS